MVFVNIVNTSGGLAAKETKILSEKGEKTRRLIIESASKIFFQQGFRNVSVEELCEAVGISKGSFYKYFPNRDTLVGTIIAECGSELIPLISENLSSEKDIEQIVETHYSLMADVFMSRVSVRMLGDIKSCMPEMWQGIENWRRAEFEGLKSLLERGQREGSIKKAIDPKVTVLMFREIIQSFFRPDFLISENLTLKQVFSTIISMFLRGIMEPKKK